MSEAAPSTATDSPNAAAGTSTQAPIFDEAKTSPEPAKAVEPAKEAAPTEPAKAPEPAKAEPEKAAEPEKKEPAKEAETKPTQEQKKVAPEKYDLKLPRGSALSEKHLEKVSAYAKERGYTNEEAQSLVERESEAVSDFKASQAETLKEAQSKWTEIAKTDKEIGGEAFKQNVELAKRVAQKFGSEAFIKEVNETGLGNHPELVRVFVRIGKAMSSDQLVIPGAQFSGSKSIEATLWGSDE